MNEAKSKLDIEINRTEEGVVIIHLSGPIDSSSINHFKETMASLFRERGQRIILDCAGVSYMNSSAVGALTGYRRRCYTDGGLFYLSSLNPKITRTLELLGLRNIFKVFPSLEDAKAALQ